MAAFDMAAFQASTFGPVAESYNGIVQNWAFNDDFPNTVVRYFDLQQDVLDSINSTGAFDYALLSNNIGANTDTTDSTTVPEPGSLVLFGLGLIGLRLRRLKS
jgi:hypothetical protein